MKYPKKNHATRRLMLNSLILWETCVPAYLHFTFNFMWPFELRYLSTLRSFQLYFLLENNCSNRFCCHIQPKGLLYDAERDLLAIAKFLVRLVLEICRVIWIWFMEFSLQWLHILNSAKLLVASLQVGNWRRRYRKFLALLIRLVIESSYLLRLVETGLYAINLTFFHSLVMK